MYLARGGGEGVRIEPLEVVRETEHTVVYKSPVSPTGLTRMPKVSWAGKVFSDWHAARAHLLHEADEKVEHHADLLRKSQMLVNMIRELPLPDGLRLPDDPPPG